MKVLHINTSNSGGAAKAALRLHSALLNSGIDSNLLYLDNEDKMNINKAYQFPKFYPDLWQRIMRKAGLKRFKSEKIS